MLESGHSESRWNAEIPSALNDAARDEFLEIVLRYLDGELDRDAMARLNGTLRDSPEHRELFVEFCTRAQLIREVADPERISEMCPGQDTDGVIAHLKLSKATVARSTAGRRFSVRLVAATSLLVAAALILACVLWVSREFDEPAPRPANSMACLVQAIEAEWHVGSRTPEKGDDVSGCVLHLDSGLAKLRFRKGAMVTLEGPAEFEVVSDELGRLRSGSLTATVPPEAIGFRVDTPAMRVVDLGTAFGIAVDETGTTDVCVFDGEVEVEPALARSGEKRVIQHGAAVRVELGHAEINETEFDAAQFSRSWPVTAGVLRTLGMVRFAPPGPPQGLVDIEDDEHLLILPERDCVELPRKTKVNLTQPGQYRGRGVNQAERLPPGMCVRSYLVQFNPVGGRTRKDRRRLVGVATFEHPIVGIITSSKLLQATDRKLGGHPERFAQRGRGLEAAGVRDRDTIRLNEDRRTLFLDLRVSGPRLDQIRVLVDASAY